MPAKTHDYIYRHYHDQGPEDVAQDLDEYVDAGWEPVLMSGHENGVRILYKRPVTSGGQPPVIEVRTG